MTWKDAYWRLFHILKQWLILQGARDDVSGRRNYDNFYKGFREDLDQLTMQLPKE